MTESDRKEVVIQDYDSKWPMLYERERTRLMEAAREAIVEIHHVGSTSVSGLAAKPIVDLAAELKRFLDESEIARVCALGYEYRGIDEDIQRQYFSKTQAPAFHLHSYLPDNPELGRLIMFRDYLRGHPEIAQEYESLKRHLAKQFRFERTSYQDAKTEFVLGIERLASGSLER